MYDEGDDFELLHDYIDDNDIYTDENKFDRNTSWMKGGEKGI